MATLDRLRLSQADHRSSQVSLESRDGAVWLSLNGSGKSRALCIRLEPKDAVGMGAQLLELGLVLGGGLSLPRGH